jgi:hypothetical protein
MCHAEDVFELPSSHDWKLIFDFLEIQKQRALDEAEADHEIQHESESKYEPESEHVV